MSKPKTNVYIDGFNLYHGALKRNKSCRWLDLSALCQRLLPHDRIHRIRYFTAHVNHHPKKPYQSLHQQIYLRALRTIPSLSVHLGKFLTKTNTFPLVGSGEMVRIKRAEEKGSDVNLAMYMLLDVFRQDCETTVVITNDSDQQGPIECLQTEFGVSVGVVNPYPRERRSKALQPTFFKQIEPAMLHNCQFPVQLKDCRGTIHKPAPW